MAGPAQALLPEPAGPGRCDAASQALQRMAVLFLGFIALVCLHGTLVQLRAILVPFVLSSLLVFSVEPTAESIFQLLAGIAPPYRWCGCCWKRQRTLSQMESAAPHGREVGAESASSGADAGASSDDESAPLLRHEAESGSIEHFWEGLCRLAAVSLVIMFMFFVLSSFVSLLVRGALHMQESWESYGAGLHRLLKWFDDAAWSMNKKFNLRTDPQFKAMCSYMLTKAQDEISSVVGDLASGVSSCVSSFFIVLLYVLFWLLKPLPLAGRTGALVRSYIWKKTLVSLLYGFCVSALFFLLGNDLAIFFGMISFFLNYVPEVGSIISIIVPIPVIMLDGRLDSPVLTACTATIGQVLLKLVFNNLLELKLVEQDKEMSIHPVWVLLNLNYFGYVWGPIGMLISVPMLALLKSYALSEVESNVATTTCWAETLLSCLEGRPGRPSARRSARLSMFRRSAQRPSWVSALRSSTKEKDDCSSFGAPWKAASTLQAKEASVAEGHALAA